MFTAESLRKAMNNLHDAEKRHESIPAEEIKMCISSGNQKIGRVMNVSLPPVVTCRNCKQCIWYCYDIKAVLQYPKTVADARMRNLSILRRNRGLYFETIEKKLSRRRKNKYFRWHVSGEIPDVDYLDHMVSIAARFPDWIFWTYTKHYDIVNQWVAAHGGTKESVPSNLTIMFSKWDGLPMENPYGFPVFAVVLKNGNVDGDPREYCTWTCPGNCDICKAAHRGCVAGESTAAKEH